MAVLAVGAQKMVNGVPLRGAGLGASWSVTQNSWGPLVGRQGPPKFLSRVGAPWPASQWTLDARHGPRIAQVSPLLRV